MYRQGNVYFVSYEDFRRKEESIGYGFILAGITAMSLMAIGASILPTKPGDLEKAVLRLYVKEDKDAVDFST